MNCWSPKEYKNLAEEEERDDTSYIQQSFPKSEEIHRGFGWEYGRWQWKLKYIATHQLNDAIVENELIAKLKQVDSRNYFQKN